MNFKKKTQNRFWYLPVALTMCVAELSTPCCRSLIYHGFFFLPLPAFKHRGCGIVGGNFAHVP